MHHPVGRESGDIVVGWLVRLVVALTVAGVLALDGISVGVAALATTDQAAAASRAGSTGLLEGGSTQAAYDAALAAVAAEQPLAELPVDGFTVGADRSVTVTVRRQAPTFVLHHVPGSRRWLTVTATSTHSAG